ncbi:hypothetical protein MKW98_013381 [Papaver atlanticum]|uniref:Uncharacterized protein n=1 Tax=Papaver atlanticum TaxID=357466 RepID=A0AAD4SU71_9MAGN|nr:hypothetical protein MKW98_013381 [Papaver atlanticum]
MAVSKKTLFMIFILLAQTLAATHAEEAPPSECGSETGKCINKSKALPLKIIAFFAILITSIVGVNLPLITKNVKALQPDRDIFTIVKAFASGIILATGFMHVLPDSFNDLSSVCLPDKPWHTFPFTGFVAMLSAIFTLMIDSIFTSYSQNKNAVENEKGNTNGDVEIANGNPHSHGHGHSHGHSFVMAGDVASAQLTRYRVIAVVLECGIVVHSVVIGISLGASSNVCSIKPLVAALCFHQMFEGMGLGGCILQAEYTLLKKSLMAFFFATTTPLGILVGLLISKSYRESSPQALITEGLLNAASAGLLIYMALVDLLAADFMGRKLQGSIKLQLKSYVAVLLGAGGMSVMALWA